MKDEEFVKNLTPNIYKYYKEAKLYCVDCPDHSLVCIRSLCDEIIVELLNSVYKYNFKEDLFSAIKRAYEHKIITFDQYNNLNQLRSNGNKGAHPNRYDISSDEKKLLAKKSIYLAFDTIKKCYLNITGNICPVDIEFFEDYYSYDYCYEALFSSDFDSKCKVGLISKDKYCQTKDENYYKQAIFFFSQGIGVHPESTYQYGVTYIPVDGNTDQAEACIEIAANLGHVQAKSHLAQFYRDGSKLFKIDYEKSRLLFEEAAKCGDIEALSDLGSMYLGGIGVDVDLLKAFELFEKAALGGDPIAQYNLSCCYIEGIGVPSDVDKGIEWLKISSSQNFAKSKAELAEMYLQGTYVPADKKLAEKLYEEICVKFDDKSSGYNEEAVYNYAIHLSEGHFGKPDFVKCLMLFAQLYFYEPTNADIREKIRNKSPEITNILLDKILNFKNFEDNIKYLKVLGFYKIDGTPFSSLEEVEDKKNENMKIINKLKIENSNHKYSEKIMRGSERNLICPCGSKKKFKKCCGK